MNLWLRITNLRTALANSWISLVAMKILLEILWMQRIMLRSFAASSSSTCKTNKFDGILHSHLEHHIKINLSVTNLILPWCKWFGINIVIKMIRVRHYQSTCKKRGKVHIIAIRKRVCEQSSIMLQKLQIKSIFLGFDAFSCLKLCRTSQPMSLYMHINTWTMLWQ